MTPTSKWPEVLLTPESFLDQFRARRRSWRWGNRVMTTHRGPLLSSEERHGVVMISMEQHCCAVQEVLLLVQVKLMILRFP
jgi:hypothetical protein